MTSGAASSGTSSAGDASIRTDARASADHNTRRLLVSRFPYQIIYRVRPRKIVVVALAHVKRRPGYWKDRQ